MNKLDAATAIVRRLREAEHEAYFAGGCVRDMLLGHEPQDYDIATDATPAEVQALFEHTVPVGAAFGVVRVLTDGDAHEVATFRADGPPLDGRRPASVRFSHAREDVLRRDFTINGMLYDPIEECVLDWVGGREDLKRRIIRAIGDPRQRFREDRLRMVRAVRFAARFECAIERATYDAIVKQAETVTVVSMERLRDELVKMLTGPYAGRGVRLLRDTGLLHAVLAEIEAMVGVDQPPQFHPEGDVFEHTCMMLDMAEAPSPELALAVLLHDIGKPPTQTFVERIRFDEHDVVGAAMAREVCRRLRCSRAQTGQVEALVANHMRLALAPRMKESTLRRLLGMPRFDEHLELHRLDCLSSHRKLDCWGFLRAKQREFAEEKPLPPPLLTGRDLIALGLKPGPLFGRILGDVEERQLERELRTAADALDYVERTYLGEQA